MSSLIKMKIIAYTNQEMTTEHSSYTLQVNPANIKFDKGIELTTQGPIGGQYRAPKYAKHSVESLDFDAVLDGTGVVSELDGGISEQINMLEDVVYNINGDIHRPNYLKISWGTIQFNGVLKSLKYDYTLFASDGSPLRIKISFNITGFIDKVQSTKLENKSSPDLSHHIVMKAGDTISAMCNKIYGDSSYCIEIAEYNQLTNFRKVEAGTILMFPPLK